MKTFRKLIIKASAFTFLPLLILFNLFFYLFINDQFQKGVKQTAQVRAALLKNLLSNSGVKNFGEQLQEGKPGSLKISPFNLKIYDSNDSLIFNWNEIVGNNKSIFDFLNRKEISKAENGLLVRELEHSGRTLFTYFSTAKIGSKNYLLIQNFYSSQYEKQSALLLLSLIIFDLLALFSFLVFFLYLKNVLKNQTKKLNNLMLNDLENEAENELLDELQQSFFVHRLKLKEKSNENISVEKSKRELIYLLDMLSEGAAIFNENFEMEYCNKTFENLLKKKNEKFVAGRSVFNLIEFPPLLLTLEEFKENKTAIKDASKYYGNKFLEYSILPLAVNKNEKRKFVIIVRDIKKIKQLEAMRKDFVANVSHEFKTPLTSIRGFTETLLDGGLKNSEIALKFLNKIYNQTFKLENLVNDLLELNRLESNMPAGSELTEVKPVFEDIAGDFRLIAKGKGLQLLTQINLPDNLQIKGEKNLLTTILSNLLLNAIQYSKRNGNIYLKAEFKEGKIITEIRDEGIGIEKDELERIFERFYRTKKASEIFKEGSGLGLSLVKHALELLNGKIYLSSKPGSGSSFKFEIPA